MQTRFYPIALMLFLHWADADLQHSATGSSAGLYGSH